MSASSVFDMFLQYIDHNYVLGILFLISVIYYICKVFLTEKKQGLAALLVVIFLFLTIFNPFLFDRLTAIADGGTSYYRFIWIIPFVAVSGCFLAEMVFAVYQRIAPKQPSNSRQTSTIKTRKSFLSSRGTAKIASAVVALILSAAILFSGTSYLSGKNLTVPENKFNISRAALDISQFIRDDPDHDGQSVILAPTEIMMELLAYDITLIPALPRDEYLTYGSGESYYEALLSLVLEGAQRGTGYIAYYLYTLDVEYVAALTLFELDDYMENLDYPVYNRTGDYTLYKRSADFDPFDYMN